MDELNTIQTIAVMAPPFILAVVLHEVSHGWVAEKLGDPTARDMGRLTLNPLRHIDLFGTIIMPLILYFATAGQFVVGSAKPVPINPYNFKNPKRDMAISSLAGPGINLVMALLCSLFLRVGMPLMEELFPKQIWEWIALPLGYILGYGVLLNVILAVLNLVPIPPLDGSRVVYWILPDKYAAIYYRLEPFGLLVILALLASGALGWLIGPVIKQIIALLVGDMAQMTL